MEDYEIKDRILEYLLRMREQGFFPRQPIVESLSKNLSIDKDRIRVFLDDIQLDGYIDRLPRHRTAQIKINPRGVVFITVEGGYEALEDAEELSEIAKYQTSARQIEEAAQERKRVKRAEQRAIRVEKRAIRAEERETISDRRAKRADRRERIMMWVIIIETILLAVSIALNIWMQ